jgi:hypothetical protein
LKVRTLGLHFGVRNLGFWVLGFGYRVWGFWVLGFRVKGLGFRVKGLGCEIGARTARGTKKAQQRA